jgi:hypothetical protein
MPIGKTCSKQELVRIAQELLGTAADRHSATAGPPAKEKPKMRDVRDDGAVPNFASTRE